MNGDPIQSSSPARPGHGSHGHSQSPNFGYTNGTYETQATLPIADMQSPYFRTAQKATSPSQFITQPTQILTTPKANRKVNYEADVQVMASSPFADRLSQSPAAPRTLPTNFAPPGTFLRRPQTLPRPAPIHLSSDDPPVVEDSDEEETNKSSIKPSVFESGKSRLSRVAETPHKQIPDFSSYAFNPNPRKRPMEETHSTLAGTKRLQGARQTGPSRAQPVQADLDLDEISDFEVRRNVQRMIAVAPGKTIRELHDALAVKRGNYNDALDLVTAADNAITIEDSDEGPLSTPPKPAPAPVNAKRQLQAPNRTIREKFTSKLPESTALPSGQSPQPKRKGKLVRGRKHPSPSPPPAQEVLPERPKQTATKTIESVEDEDEGIVIDSDSASEVGSQESSDASDDRSLLDFLNTCSVEALVDLSSQKEDVVRQVLSKRPFRSLDQIASVSSAPKAKGKGRKVAVGEKLVENARAMWAGYRAVDQLVMECRALAKPLATAMGRWGVDLFGASKDGELALTSLDDTMSESSHPRDSGIGTPRSPVAIDDTENESISKSVRNKAQFLKKPTIMSADIELKDYQLVGLNWLNLLWQHGLSCILADDMGLGKTCQVISFLSHLKEIHSPGPHLVIVPGSTLENWLREFQHFSPALSVEPYYGNMTEREEQRLRITDNVGSVDVVVTTYDLTHRPDDNKFLRRLKPEVCVFDEGHVLRNCSTKRYYHLMRIPATIRLLLTGTPLQNNLQELASILAFIMPEVFSKNEEELAHVFKHKAKTTDSDHAALLSAQRIHRAKSMMAPFVLRRKKAQVLKHLPRKTCRVEYCELTPAQQKVYSEQLGRQRKVLEDRAAGIITKDHGNVMMKLRQAAVHPLLFRVLYDDKTIKKMSKAALREDKFKDSDPDLIYEELEPYQDYQCHQLTLMYPKHLGKYGLRNQEWMDSGKVKKLAELLIKFKANGDRTLIFSQFTSVMDILEWVLSTLEMEFYRLDGSTAIARRQEMLDEFYTNTEVPVFMLSTKSGGAGINLACANKVIIFDSSFNPQDDIQAENRAHRVGQTREVEVIRLVTRGTIEEQIHALGVSKLALDQMVAGDGAASEATTDEKGIEAVEDMLFADFQTKGEAASGASDRGDLKDQFLTGLKAAGLDMSAT